MFMRIICEVKRSIFGNLFTMIWSLLVLSFAFLVNASIGGSAVYKEPILKLDPCDVVGQLKGDDKYCDQFYQCTNLGWAVLVCPYGLYFNPKISVCDWPDEVDCGNNDDDDHSKLEPCDLIGQMKGESTNCQQYYVCSEEGWVQHECRSPLLFNSISKTCDYSIYVTCAK